MNKRFWVVAVLCVALVAGFYLITRGIQSGRGIADIASLKLPQLGKIFDGRSSLWKDSPVSLYKPVADYESAVVQAVKAVSPSVVSVSVTKEIPTYENCSTYDPFGGLPSQLRQLFGRDDYFLNCENGSRTAEVGGGSGFIISEDGLILTNKHVIEDPTADYTVFMNDGTKYKAKILGRDPIQDLGVLKIDASGLPTVTLGDSDHLELGQAAIAIGNALGEFQNTVSVGVISGLGRSITASNAGGAETIQGVIQTDTAINPGNSGGPLINLRGEVIGINVAIVSGAQNIGFALPVNWAKEDIETVRSGGQLKAPYLGVRYLMVTEEIAKARDLDVDYGALLSPVQGQSAVVRNSPAAKAGLKEGDIILAMNGESLRGKDLLQLISRYSVGEEVSLDVFRDKRSTSVKVKLGERSE